MFAHTPNLSSMNSSHQVEAVWLCLCPTKWLCMLTQKSADKKTTYAGRLWKAITKQRIFSLKAAPTSTLQTTGWYILLDPKPWLPLQCLVSVRVHAGLKTMVCRWYMRNTTIYIPRSCISLHWILAAYSDLHLTRIMRLYLLPSNHGTSLNTIAHVRMYVFMCWYEYVCTYVCNEPAHKWMDTYICICMYVRIYLYHQHTSEWIHTHAFVCMYAFISVCVCVCVHIYTEYIRTCLQIDRPNIYICREFHIKRSEMRTWRTT